MFKISIHLRQSGPEKLNRRLNSLPPWSNLNLLFPKSSNSQDHLFWEWRHPLSGLISSLGVYYEMVIVISFAHEHKTTPNDYAPELKKLE